MHIFVSVDPSFELAIGAVNELKNGNRLWFNYTATSWYPLLEANEGSILHFSRRISIAIRACMLNSIGLPNNKLYEFIRNQFYIDNQPELDGSIPDVVNYDWKDLFGRFDQLLPHYVIRKRIDNAIVLNPHKNPIDFSITAMAYIFSNDFTSVTSINTTIRINVMKEVDYKNQLIKTYSCPSMNAVSTQFFIGRKTEIGTIIQNPTEYDGNYFRLLKALISAFTQRQNNDGGISKLDLLVQRLSELELQVGVKRLKLY